MKTYNPVNCLENPKAPTSIQQAFMDKKTPTLASIQREKGNKIASAMIKTWLIYLNEALNSTRPFTETQISIASVHILSSYYMLRFADLTVLFNNIIKSSYGKEYGSLTMQRLMGLFNEYFEERCNLAESHNYSKSIEHRQNIEELGTERTSKTRR